MLYCLPVLGFSAWGDNRKERGTQGMGAPAQVSPRGTQGVTLKGSQSRVLRVTRRGWANANVLWVKVAPPGRPVAVFALWLQGFWAGM